MFKPGFHSLLLFRREKALQLTAEITAANQTLQAFKLKDLERQREAELAMEGELNFIHFYLSARVGPICMNVSCCEAALVFSQH